MPIDFFQLCCAICKLIMCLKWNCPPFFILILSKYCTTVISPEDTLITLAFYLLASTITSSIFNSSPFGWTPIGATVSVTLRRYFCAISMTALFMLCIHCWIKSHLHSKGITWSSWRLVWNFTFLYCLKYYDLHKISWMTCREAFIY